MTDHWASMLANRAIAESGGEHGNEGVDYARYLAMALLIEEELANRPDYAVVFEYLQDLLILNSPSAPTEALLVQVKKKQTGSWTKTELLKKRKAPAKHAASDPTTPANPTRQLGARSPLGKLFHSVEALTPVAKVSGLFASNAGFDLTHSNGSKVAPHVRTRLSELHLNETSHVSGALKKELKLSAAPSLDRLAVEQCKVIPGAMRETVRGMLSELISARYGTLPDIAGRLQEQLLAAFSARSGVKPGLTSLEQIVMNKGFTRAAFTEAIQALANLRPATLVLDEVIEGLKSEGVPARSANLLRRHVNKLQIQWVRSPETRDAIHWSVALDTCLQNTQSAYRPMLQAITDAVEARAKQLRQPLTNEGGATAVAVLAIMHVDQESTPARPVAPDQVQ